MLNGPLREVDSELEWLCTDWTPEKKKCIALAGQLLDSAHQRGRLRGARRAHRKETIPKRHISSNC